MEALEIDYDNEQEMRQLLGKNNFISFAELDKIDYSRLDPYTAWCTVLFKRYKESPTVTVVGYIMYEDPQQILSVSTFSLIQKPPFLTALPKSVKKPPFRYPGLNLSKASEVGVNMLEIFDFIDNIFNQDAVINYAIKPQLSLAVALLSPNAKFEELREKYERVRFERAFELLKMHPDCVSDLVLANGLHLLPLSPHEITLEDRQHFYAYFPRCPLAEIWFAVPYVEVPTLALPIYKGGLTHISYHHVGEWLWQKSIQEIRRLFTKKYMSNDKVFNKQHQLVTGYIKQLQRKTTHIDGSVIDIEDLPKVLPPCFRKLVTTDEAKRFPKNEERFAIAVTFNKRNIPMDVLETQLEILNDKFPKQPVAVSLRKRFDLQYYYDRDYGAPSCENMNACIQCPYNKDKTKCLAEFNEKWPEIRPPDQLKHFFGPGSWLYWVIQHRNWQKRKNQKQAL